MIPVAVDNGSHLAVVDSRPVIDCFNQAFAEKTLMTRYL